MLEGKYNGEFIVSEANGTLSRGAGVVAMGNVLVAGELVGIITATGKYASYDNTAVDGTETVAGISFGNYDATDADTNGVFILRNAEVRGSDLTYNTDIEGEITTAKTELESLGLIVR